MNSLPITLELARLRRIEHGGDLVNEKHIVPGFWISWDSVDGNVTGSFRSSIGGLLELSYVVHGHVRWVTLNMWCSLPGLNENDTVGFLCQARTSKPFKTVPFLRMPDDNESGFVDCPMEGEFSIGLSVAAQFVFVKATSHPELSVNAEWRNLLISLPTNSCDITFRDLRIIFGKKDL